MALIHLHDGQAIDRQLQGQASIFQLVVFGVGQLRLLPQLSNLVLRGVTRFAHLRVQCQGIAVVHIHAADADTRVRLDSLDVEFYRPRRTGS